MRQISRASRAVARAGGIVGGVRPDGVHAPQFARTGEPGRGGYVDHRLRSACVGRNCRARRSAARIRRPGYEGREDHRPVPGGRSHTHSWMDSRRDVGPARGHRDHAGDRDPAGEAPPGRSRPDRARLRDAPRRLLRPSSHARSLRSRSRGEKPRHGAPPADPPPQRSRSRAPSPKKIWASTDVPNPTDPIAEAKRSGTLGSEHHREPAAHSAGRLVEGARLSSSSSRLTPKSCERSVSDAPESCRAPRVACPVRRFMSSRYRRTEATCHNLAARMCRQNPASTSGQPGRDFVASVDRRVPRSPLR